MNDELLHRRGTREVIDDHLRLRQHGELEEDLRRNYHPNVVLLSAESVHQGHQEVRELADILASYVPHADYRYRQVLAEGPYGMLQWTARRQEVQIHDGADTYIMTGGRIIGQSIHYSTRRLADPNN